MICRLCFAILLLFSGQSLIAETFPMMGGSLSRQSRVLSASPIQGALKVKWQTQLSSLSNPISHPTVLEDRIIHTRTGVLHCLDRNTGALIWTRILNVSAQPTYEPVRGILLVINTNGILHALSPVDGLSVWSLALPGADNVSTLHSVLAEGNKAWFGLMGPSSAFFVCVDLDTRLELWRYTFPSRQAINTAAMDSGKVYLSGKNGHLACLDAGTGAAQWTKESGFPYTAMVTLSPDKLFVPLSSGAVECRRRDNGQVLWRLQPVSYSNSNLAWCNGMLVISNDDRYVRGIDDRDGKELWRRGVAGNFALNGPLIICGIVYITGCAGEYYGIDAQTGALVWTFNHVNMNSFVDMATADGLLFVSDRLNKVYCFEPQVPADPALCGCAAAPTATPVPTPLPLPGPCAYPASTDLALWFKAGVGMTLDGSNRVSQWDDQSGRGHHAVSSGTARPLFVASGQGGAPAVQFDGLASFMDILNSPHLISIKHDYTVIIKAWTDPIGPPNQEIFGNSHWPGANIFFGRRNTTDFQFNECVAVSLSQAADALAPALLIYRSSFQSIEVFKNGVLTARVGPLDYYCPLNLDQPYTLGSIAMYGGNFFKGQIEELLVFNRALSPSDRETLELCYLGVLPTHTITPTVTPTPALTHSYTHTWTRSPTRSPTPSTTATATATQASAQTSIQTASPTESSTPSATPTPSTTATQTQTSLPASSFTSTPTLSNSPSHTQTPVATSTSTPSPSPEGSSTAVATLEHTPRPTKDKGCIGPLIDRIMVSPNPSQASADRMVSLKLGCGADQVHIEVYSAAFLKIYDWTDSTQHVEKGQWVHKRYPHDDELANGTYVVRVTVTKDGRSESVSSAFVVLK